MEEKKIQFDWFEERTFRYLEKRLEMCPYSNLMGEKRLIEVHRSDDDWPEYGLNREHLLALAERMLPLLEIEDLELIYLLKTLGRYYDSWFNVSKYRNRLRSVYDKVCQGDFAISTFENEDLTRFENGTVTSPEVSV